MLNRAETACHCINLRRAANAITKIYDSEFEKIGLSANQFYLIVSLNELKMASVTELAVHVGLERTTLVRTLRPLTEAGYIQDMSEQHQRNRMLRLTEKGSEKLKAGSIVWNKLQKDIEERVGVKKIQCMESIFNQINAIEYK